MAETPLLSPPLCESTSAWGDQWVLHVIWSPWCVRLIFKLNAHKCAFSCASASWVRALNWFRVFLQQIRKWGQRSPFFWVWLWLNFRLQAHCEWRKLTKIRRESVSLICRLCLTERAGSATGHHFYTSGLPWTQQACLCSTLQIQLCVSVCTT